MCALCSACSTATIKTECAITWLLSDELAVVNGTLQISEEISISSRQKGQALIQASAQAEEIK